MDRRDFLPVVFRCNGDSPIPSLLQTPFLCGFCTLRREPIEGARLLVSLAVGTSINATVATGTRVRRRGSPPLYPQNASIARSLPLPALIAAVHGGSSGMEKSRWGYPEDGATPGESRQKISMSSSLARCIQPSAEKCGVLEVSWGQSLARTQPGAAARACSAQRN